MALINKISSFFNQKLIVNFLTESKPISSSESELVVIRPLISSSDFESDRPIGFGSPYRPSLL